jgi:AcrR family transcriptional regulator
VSLHEEQKGPETHNGRVAADLVPERIMDAVVTCVERVGLSGFALEDVAAEAGVGRATIYRHFPGGRGQLIRETVTREVARYWQELADEVEGQDDLEGRLVHGLMEANRRLADYELLHRLLAAEPQEILSALMTSEPLMNLLLRDYLRRLLAPYELVDGVDPDEAAEYLSRMLLTYIGSPGRWDTGDIDEVRRLVRTQFLGGIVAPGATHRT